MAPVSPRVTKKDAPAIRLVIFDLDDTLIDTTRELVPAANREAARALVAAGVPGPVLRCERLRARAARRAQIADADSEVCRRLGIEDDAVAEAGRRAFYARAGQLRHRGVLRLMPGARVVLEELARERTLVLITWGDPETQWAKVRAANAARFFQDIRVVDRLATDDKAGAIRDVLQRQHCPPRAALVVGDSWEREIVAGARLGAWTCWVRPGPARGGSNWPPQTPDAVIGNPLEIPRVVARLERRMRRLTRSRAAL